MPLLLHNPCRKGSKRRAATTGISRRAFLAVCAAGCARSVRPRSRSEVRWALLADTHISHDHKLEINGSRMTEALKGVVAEIVSDDFDRVLVNGDVAFRSGEAGDYVRFREVIQPVVARGIPIHLTLGNHDHREHFLSGLVPPHEKAMGTKVVCSRIDRGTHWILLDSLDKVNGIPGTLGAAQLDWMARRLDAHQDAPAIICLHHNPEVSLSGLTDTRAFLQSVRPRRQVKAVIFGHTHEFHVSSDEGLHLINLPAVGYRFRSDKSRGWLSASISRNEMSITFNCLDKSESSCGGAQVLTWRSDKSS